MPAANHARYFRAATADIGVVTNVDHNVHTIFDPKKIVILHYRGADQPRGERAPLTTGADLTLDEIVAAMRKRRIAGSRSAVWRFFERHNISFKKKPAGGGASTPGRGPGAAALDARIGHV